MAESTTETSVGYGAAAVAVLHRLIARHQGDDPLAPVTVVVPSGVAGVLLRRGLVAGRGVANVRFVPAAELAELLAGRGLAAAGRTPLTDPVLAEHVRQALAAAPGALGAAALHPATERLALRALAELRRATAAGGEDQVLAVLDAGPPLSRTLAGLHRRVRAAVAPLHYDEHDLALAAARPGGRAGQVGGVIVFLPDALSPAETLLVGALAERTRVDVLRGEAAPAVPAAAVCAPDADEEVRGVVRAIARLLRSGRSLARVAVLYADPEPYATLAAEHLAAADLPANGPAARTLGQAIPGRTLLDLLALPDADHARPAVLDWLGVAPLPLPVDRWAEVAEAAGVGRGRDSWQHRLRAYLARGPDAPQAADAAALLAFTDALFAELEGPANPTWTGAAGWALGLLDRCLGDDREGWPEQDRRAEVAVRERLAGLAALDAVGAPGKVDLDTVRRVLRAELDQPAGRLGQFGVGVYLGPVESAVALHFDHVFVVGMAEGAFPARPSEQPLLPDALRRRLRLAALPTREERLARQRAALLAVLSSGAETVLSHPRSDRRQQRERTASPWFLELAAGAPRQDVPSLAAAIEHAEEPATSGEWVARELVVALRHGQAVTDAPVVAADPALAAALGVVRRRASEAFTAWDGLVGPHAALERHLQRRHAPTSLSRYATCPRQYFLAGVLGVREREDRDEPLALEGARRGVVFHGILERFLKALASEPPATPAGRRRLLHRLADGALAPAGAESLGWRLEADRMRTWLDRWFDEHEAMAAQLDVRPVGAEVAFGDPADPLGALEVVLPSGRSLALHGRIDRLDASPDGTALVIDYKTSLDERFKGIESDPVLAGTQLQLAVYALAVAGRYAQVDARYWFLGPRTSRAAQRGFVLDPERERRTVQVLDVLTDGIATGTFPARPGAWDDWQNEYAHCRSCAFDRICPAPGERERTWERDARAPQVARYRELVEP
jgi:RecB family exonuclease